MLFSEKIFQSKFDVFCINSVVKAEIMTKRQNFLAIVAFIIT